MAKFKIYAGALDGEVLHEESDNKTDLVTLYEAFAQKHDVVTATLVDDTGKNLNEDLSGHRRAARLDDWA